MPNRGAHITIGAAICGLAYVGYKSRNGEPITLSGLLGSVILGGIAAVLPDLPEPATDPNHRAFFHSITLLLTLGWANYKVSQSPSINPSFKRTLALVSLGYASHLIADSITPKGLPFLN